MEIFINGEIKKIEQEVNLLELLNIFSLPVERVAIEINKEVIRKKNWASTKVNDGDKIEIVHFVGGG